MHHFWVLPFTLLWVLTSSADNSFAIGVQENIPTKTGEDTAWVVGEPEVSGLVSAKFVADAVVKQSAFQATLATPSDQLQVIASSPDVVFSRRPRFIFLLSFGTTASGLAALFAFLWRRRKSALASNVAQLAASYEAMDIGILAIDLSGDTLATNSEFRRLTGISYHIYTA